MRTYTHGIIGYLLYAKSSLQEKKLAILGGITPDIILAIGFVFHYLDQGPGIFNFLHDLFHHSWLHTVTMAMHSFVIIGVLFLFAHVLYKPAKAFFVGMFAHAVLDLLTHTRWAYNHFFPLPLEPFQSFISYTSLWFIIFEHAFVVLFIVWYYRKKTVKKK